jgi:SAM-dependent methyltransferase
MFASLRARLLQRAFSLLYARLAGLHEVAGRVLFGEAWNARRIDLVRSLTPGLTLDLGSGEGRLLASLAVRGDTAVGLEPSRQMAVRASKRGCLVVRGTAQAMPFQRCAFSNVAATYPGPWILESQTWDEIARVTRPGASVRILLGGSTDRGRGSSLRRIAQRIAYGGQQNGRSRSDLPVMGNALVVGDYKWVADPWGEAYCWCGTRVG